MRKNSRLNRIICFALGLITVFNLIVFFPEFKTEVEAEESGTGYRIITAADLYNGGNHLSTSSHYYINYDSTYGFIRFKATAAGDTNAVIDVTSFGISSNTYHYIVMTGKTVTKAVADTSAQLFYVTEKKGVDGNYSGIFVDDVSGKYVSHVMSVSSAYYNTGNYGKLRFDVFGNSTVNDEYRLESLIFCNSYELAQALAWKRATTLNGSAPTSPVFKGVGLLNLFDEYNSVYNTSANNNYINYDYAEDAVKISSGVTSNDPQLNFSVDGVAVALGMASFSATNYKYIVVTYKSSDINVAVRKSNGFATEPNMQFYLMTGTIKNASAAESNGLAPVYLVRSDGDYHSVIIDTESMANWSGDIHGFRFDFFGAVVAGEYMYIDSIGFYQAGNDTNTGRRQAASDAARNNVLNRRSNNANNYLYNGQIYAYYDTLAMISEYRWPKNSKHFYEYDPEEGAVKISANGQQRDPTPTFELGSNTAVTVGNSPYVVITYMVPLAQYNYAQGRLFLFTDTVVNANSDYSITFDLIADGKYHSYVLNLNAFDGKANWKDSDHITGVRLDYVDALFDYAPLGTTYVKDGEYIYLDSILFCSSESKAETLAWERYSEKNYVDGEFIMGPESLQHFGGKSHSGISISYDETEEAIKYSITSARQNPSGTLAANQHYDPSVYFYIPDNTPLTAGAGASDYKYLVITYKTDSQFFTGNSDQVSETFHLVGSTTSPTGGRSTRKMGVSDDQYHALIMDMNGASYWSGNIIGFRFDFVGTGTVDDNFWIDSIVYCKSEDEAYDVAFERTWWRNHERGTGTRQTGVFDHWEQMYLMDTERSKVDTASTSFTENLTVNGIATTEGGVRVTENQVITYNVDNRGLVTDNYNYVIVTYKLEEGTYGMNSVANQGALKTNVSSVWCTLSVETANMTDAQRQYATFTNQVFGDADVDMKAGNEFHSFRIDLSVFGGMSNEGNPLNNYDDNRDWWRGEIDSLSISFTDNYGDGLVVYIESIIFVSGDDQTSGYNAYHRTRSINGESPEGYRVGNEFTYYATPEMVMLFGYRHMTEATYDEAHMAIKLSVCQYCRNYLAQGTHVDASGNKCTAPYFTGVADEGGFDPQIRFSLPVGGITIANSGFLVVTYLTPSTQNGMSDIIGKFPNSSALGLEEIEKNSMDLQDYGNRTSIGIFPIANGIANPDYTRGFDIFDQETFYAAYVDMNQEGIGNTLSEIRFDIFNNIHYPRKDVAIFISTIVLAGTEARAQEIVDSMLDSRYPYNYVLSFSAGDGASDPTLKGLPSAQQKSRSNQNTFSFDLTYAVPSRLNYDFAGWENEYTGAITAPGSKVLIQAPAGATSKVIVTRTLTAQWKEKTATFNYQIVAPANNMATLSMQSQTVGIVSGTPEDVIISLTSDHFWIEGWYYDEACTQKIVDGATLSASNITSIKVDNGDGAFVWRDAVFYAKVDYVTSDMTISLENLVTSDSDQNFIVTITAVNDKVANNTVAFAPLSVVLKNGESVVIKGLYGGDYTITVNNKWSWRFSTWSTSKTVNNQLAQAPEVNISYSAVIENRWLNDVHMVSK